VRSSTYDFLAGSQGAFVASLVVLLVVLCFLAAHSLHYAHRPGCEAWKAGTTAVHCCHGSEGNGAPMGELQFSRAVRSDFRTALGPRLRRRHLEGSDRAGGPSRGLSQIMLRLAICEGPRRQRCNRVHRGFCKQSSITFTLGELNCVDGLSTETGFQRTEVVISRRRVYSGARRGLRTSLLPPDH